MTHHFGLLILRVALAGLMLPHGIRKLASWWSRGEVRFSDPLGLGPEVSFFLAVFAEVFCSILLIIGYKTRLASIPLAFTMIVASFIAHFDDPWAKKELALVYLAGFAAIAFLGGGRYSLDAYLRRSAFR